MSNIGRVLQPKDSDQTYSLLPKVVMFSVLIVRNGSIGMIMQSQVLRMKWHVSFNSVINRLRKYLSTFKLHEGTTINRREHRMRCSYVGCGRSFDQGIWFDNATHIDKRHAAAALTSRPIPTSNYLASLISKMKLFHFTLFLPSVTAFSPQSQWATARFQTFVWARDPNFDLSGNTWKPTEGRMHVSKKGEGLALIHSRVILTHHSTSLLLCDKHP